MTSDQFRASLRLQSARRALDVFLGHSGSLAGYRLNGAGDESLHELHYVDEASGVHPFSLSVAEGELQLSVHEAGFGRVPGGLPALEAGFGPVSETPDGSWRLRVSKPRQALALIELLFARQSAAALRVSHWWVNHTDGHRAQIEGSYLWASKPTISMTRVMPGDVMFSLVSGAVAAIGIVMDRARSTTDPGASRREGWLLPVRMVELQEPLQLQALSDEFKLPRVYLAEIPDSHAKLLRELLSRQVEDMEERIVAESEGKLTEQAIEEHIWQRTDIGARDKRQLSNARLGQGAFRDNVERIETACRVTGILDRRYLRATHIKPWKDANDREKLDGANGLLLSPHIIHLFDRGHICFADDGSLMISRHLNPYVLKAWNLERPALSHAFKPEQRVYLDYHRTHIFERVGGGRRSP